MHISIYWWRLSIITTLATLLLAKQISSRNNHRRSQAHTHTRGTKVMPSNSTSPTFHHPPPSITTTRISFYNRATTMSTNKFRSCEREFEDVYSQIARIRKIDLKQETFLSSHPRFPANKTYGVERTRRTLRATPGMSRMSESVVL